ncbi:MAG: PQQ-binding-like beta-propeller repeat protein [Cryomorphaceae bacterium]|nr:PQQ-binding-like beta-propeller repeat protein [Cryomorphaceae bacterium]
MDSDGYYEIVFATYTNDGRVHCLNAENGTEKWIYDIGGCGDVALLIYDVDQDDTLDVLVNGSCNPTMFCINGATGQLKWSKPSGGGDSPPTVADMDGDSKPEILFCNFGGQLRILNGEDGSTNKVIAVDPFGGTIQTEPTLVDVNLDGRLDVILANYFNVNGLYVWAYDYMTADVLWTNYTDDTSSSFNAYHGGAVADIDGNGDLEYVIGSNNGFVRALNVADGSVLWSKAIPKSCMGALSIADLDGDGDLEIVVTNNDWVTLDERIWVLDGATGNTEWSYPTTFSSFRGCAIADINGNGILDLVAGYFMGDVIAVEPYTGLIWETNLLSQFPAGLPYLLVDHGPLVADFDKNGTMDVFIVAGYGTYTPDLQNTGKAFMLEAGIGQCPEWLMFRQDEYRSGYLSEADIAASCAQVLSVEEEAILAASTQVYPNPVTHTLNITASVGQDVWMYNVMGELMYAFKASDEHTELNLTHWPAGVYLLMAGANDEYFTHKFIKQ